MPPEQYPQEALYDIVGPVFGENWKTAAAIVMAESGGKTRARNVNKDGSIDRGLFQINNKAHPNVSDACADNPQCAARAALRISSGGKDWSPWSAYKNGAYRKFLDGKLPDADDAGTFGVTRGPGLDTQASKLGGDFLERLNILFEQKFWQRVGFVAAGAIAIIIGIVLIGKDFLPTAAVGKAIKRSG